MERTEKHLSAPSLPRQTYDSERYFLRTWFLWNFTSRRMSWRVYLGTENLLEAVHSRLVGWDTNCMHTLRGVCLLCSFCRLKDAWQGVNLAKGGHIITVTHDTTIVVKRLKSSIVCKTKCGNALVHNILRTSYV